MARADRRRRDALAAALHRQIFIPLGPDATERAARRSSTRCIELGRGVRRPRDRSARPRLPAARATSSSATSPASTASSAAYARLAEELRLPQHLWHTSALRGMRAMIDGDLEEAERLAEEARRRRRARRAAARGAVLRDPADPDPPAPGPGRGAAAGGAGAGRALSRRSPPGARALISLARDRPATSRRRRVELERFAARRLLRDPEGRQLARRRSRCSARRPRCSATEARRDCSTTSCCPTRALVIVVARAAACRARSAGSSACSPRRSGALDDAERASRGAHRALDRMGDRPVTWR